MKRSWLFISLMIATSGCSSQENISKKEFGEIVLVNKIQFVDSKFDQEKFSCGFLLKHGSDTVAVTAKHLLQIIRPDGMKTLSIEDAVKQWSLYNLDNPGSRVICNQLLNTNVSELLDKKSTYQNDWLVFSIKENHSAAKSLEARTTPLSPGEKLYVVGWTRKMDTGKQRVYEFEYYKTIGNRILLKEVIVPEQFGGLSGAPLVDEEGKVVGIVSNGTVDPDTDKKYFSPCAITSLISFLDKPR